MKSNTFIIIIMVSLIFLGILWLKCNKGIREGIEPSASGDVASMQSLSTSILNDVNSRLMAGGIDTATITTSLPGFIDQINDMVTKEAGIFTTTTAPVDLSTVIDTTERDKYPGQSFFTGTKFSAGFCPNNSDPTKGDQCKLLTTENCNQTDCCIVLNGSKCVRGNADGPLDKIDDKGRDIDYAYYSYKNECYGSCGKGLAGVANPCSGYSDADTGISEACINRYWKASTCPNPNYLTPEVMASLQSMNKAQIQVQFKNLVTDEPNYAKCYGPNEGNWPAPCTGTSSGSQKLSGRCLKKLLDDSGCPNTSLIDDAYVFANSAKSKSEMINTFAALNVATDNESLVKCYGPDELSWPDPCTNVPDSARLYRGEIPLRCIQKLWRDNTSCPSPDYITDFYNSSVKNKTPTEVASLDKYTKAAFIKDLRDNAETFQNNRFKCFGVNPNNWPTRLGITPFTPLPDPCSNLTPSMPINQISDQCKQRLIQNNFEIFPLKNCGKTAASRLTVFSDIMNFINNTTKRSTQSAISALSELESRYQKACPVPVEYLLGVGVNDKMLYIKPTATLSTSPWVRQENSGEVNGAIMLNDGRIWGRSKDNGLIIKNSLDSKDKWQGWVSGKGLGLAQFSSMDSNDNKDKIIHLGSDFNSLWISDSPTNVGWYRYSINNMVLITFTIGNDGNFIGIGFDLKLYTNNTPMIRSPNNWVKVNDTMKLISVTQLTNGTFVGLDINNNLCTSSTLENPIWSSITPISNDIKVKSISTISI
jgi:hypothetical protein